MFGQAVHKQTYSQEKGSRSKWSTLNNIKYMYMCIVIFKGRGIYQNDGKCSYTLNNLLVER